MHACLLQVGNGNAAKHTEYDGANPLTKYNEHHLSRRLRADVAEPNRRENGIDEVAREEPFINGVFCRHVEAFERIGEHLAGLLVAADEPVGAREDVEDEKDRAEKNAELLHPHGNLEGHGGPDPHHLDESQDLEEAKGAHDSDRHFDLLSPGAASRFLTFRIAACADTEGFSRVRGGACRIKDNAAGMQSKFEGQMGSKSEEEDPQVIE